MLEGNLDKGKPSESLGRKATGLRKTGEKVVTVFDDRRAAKEDWLV